MFFTRVGRIIAWLMVVLGALMVTMGIVIASTDRFVAPEYLGTQTTGETIDRGLILILIGVVVGILAEVSRSVATRVPTVQPHDGLPGQARQ